MPKKKHPSPAGGRRSPSHARAGGRGDDVVGVFKRAAAGHGFVRPAGAADATQDIRVPAPATADAATGTPSASGSHNPATSAGRGQPARSSRS